MPNPYGKWVHDPLAPSGFRWRRHNEHPATEMIPIITPSPTPRPGENDHLVERTYNGLRRDDLDLEQPPQSPAWTPR